MGCLVWWFVQDWIKCGCYVVLDRFDIFSYRTFMDPDGPAVAPTQRRNEAGGLAQPSFPRTSTERSFRLPRCARANPSRRLSDACHELHPGVCSTIDALTNNQQRIFDRSAC